MKTNKELFKSIIKMLERLDSDSTTYWVDSRELKEIRETFNELYPDEE